MAKLNITVIASNKRTTPYLSSTDDQLEVMVQLYKDGKLLNMAGVPIELWLDFPSWQKYITGITNRFGGQTLYQSCASINGISNCLGYVKATVLNEEYSSNLIRFNFINTVTFSGELQAIAIPPELVVFDNEYLTF